MASNKASNEPLTVQGLGDIRAQLSHVLRQFASMGVDAPEYFFGRHRKPEAVIISYDRWRQLTGKDTGAQPSTSTTPPRQRDRSHGSRLPGKGPEEIDPDLLAPSAAELSDEELRALGRRARASPDSPDTLLHPGVPSSRSQREESDSSGPKRQ